MLIDFVPTVSGVRLADAPAFKLAPGGAPANVAVGLARLGVPAGFMGKVGDDAFGHLLAETLQKNGVDISALCFTTEARTALAFVSLRADGEREFMFYRHPSADMLWTPEDVDDAYIRRAKIFHFGTISLIREPSRSATLRAVEIAAEAGLLISFDPNLRLPLWSSEQAAKEGMLLGLAQCQVIKLSQEELNFMTGAADADPTIKARQIWHPALRLMVVTQGSQGCTFITPSFSTHVPGFSVDAVDSTGAGDGFVAGLLKGLLEHPHADESRTLLYEICRYANAVGAISTTERGAIPALPNAVQVERFLQDNSNS